MKTRNELLDRLIKSLKENQYYLYKCWMHGDTLEEWSDNKECKDSLKYQSEINELQGYYD